MINLDILDLTLAQLNVALASGITTREEVLMAVDGYMNNETLLYWLGDRMW